jgi:isocitrate/isopropylmalate dehydrogenase
MIIVRELTGGIYYGTPRGITGSGAEERTNPTGGSPWLCLPT